MMELPSINGIKPDIHKCRVFPFGEHKYRVMVLAKIINGGFPEVIGHKASNIATKPINVCVL